MTDVPTKPATEVASQPGPAETPPLTITLDGRPVTAEKGELIIAVAEREGIFIPRFCYHPRMKPVGMCRMCLVEVVGPRGATLQPACYVSVADGQEVITDSPKVRKAQEGVLEFLLVNHPLDCPVCDKGGECPLQDQTLSYGPGETRFIEEKRHFEKPIPISHLVALDRERCIQCARCTRFAEEVAGEPLIDFYGRGDRVEVSIFPGQPFASYFSGNTVQICPVGALTATPYRFKSRPWDLEQAETTCTTCSVGCRVVVQSSAGRMVRYLGIDSDPVNQGWLCDKGRFGFAAGDAEDRLLAPMVRGEGSLADAHWNTALRRAASLIESALSSRGPGSVAVIGGARLTNEGAYAWAKLAKSVIGTDWVDAQLGDGLPAEMVLGLPGASIDDACNARAVLLLSPDLREELPVLFLRLRHAALEKGLPIVELSSSPTSLTRYSKAALAYRPGEAAVAVRGLLGAVSGKVGASGGSGTAGIAAGELAAAADLLRAALGGDADGPGDGGDGSGLVVVIGRPSLAEAEGGIVDAASALVERFPAARFLPVLRRANVRGALEMGLAPGMLPGRVSLADGGDWFAAPTAWGKVPAERGGGCGEILQAAAAGEIESLILLGADPVADFPDRELATARPRNGEVGRRRRRLPHRVLLARRRRPARCRARREERHHDKLRGPRQPCRPEGGGSRCRLGRLDDRGGAGGRPGRRPRPVERPPDHRRDRAARHVAPWPDVRGVGRSDGPRRRAAADSAWQGRFGDHRRPPRRRQWPDRPDRDTRYPCGRAAGVADASRRGDPRRRGHRFRRGTEPPPPGGPRRSASGPATPGLRSPHPTATLSVSCRAAAFTMREPSSRTPRSSRSWPMRRASPPTRQSSTASGSAPATRCGCARLGARRKSRWKVTQRSQGESRL